MSWIFDLPLVVLGPTLLLVLVGLALGSVHLFRRHMLPQLRFGEHDAVFSGTMLTAIMVIYGLAMALIAVHVWETYEEVARTVSHEASTLGTLYRDVSEYPEPTRTLLREHIRDYVEYTIHEAWAMQRRGIVPSKGLARVDSIQATLFRFEPVTEGQKVLAAETANAYNVMIEARRMRLDAVETRLPGVMWIVIVVGAVISLLSALFFPVHDERIQRIQVALLSMFIGIVIFMIIALDRPYHGDLGLTPRPYELIYEQLMQH